MAITAQFVATPKVGLATISTANTSLTGSGTLGTVFSAGANGSRIERCVVKATGTTTTGMVRLFIHNGTAATLLTEIPVALVTPSVTLPAFETTLVFDGGLVIPTGYSLRAATHNAESFQLTALGGDF